MNFTIEEFWKHRLSASIRGNSDRVQGWRHVENGLATFLEAPLTLGQGFGDADPTQSDVLLVSAPGAVGKSTLARQIAFETGAMLVDLAKAQPVGANTVVGGLAKTELYTPFQQGQASLIIDGLDEARMRVTQDSLAAFMGDVVQLTESHPHPIVLLGRTGAVQEAWLWLSENGIEVPVFEIGYYDKHQAAEFAKIQAQNIRDEPNRREPDGRAIDLLLDRLRDQTSVDGGTFAGYSPVLIAVAKQVADPNNPSNTQQLISRIQKEQEQVTLAAISQSILHREQGKLQALELDDKALRDKLYTPEEQLARLVARLYLTTPCLSLPPMSAKDQENYNTALENWVSEHPFLDGEGQQPSSAVFGGQIASEALRSPSAAEAALSTELGRGTAINPFIAEFYKANLDIRAETPPTIPADHIGIFYASLRARLSLGQTASLRIDGDIDPGDDEAAEIEITGTHNNGVEFDPLYFTSEHDGHFRFGSTVEDVDIIAPHAQVSVGHGSEVVFVAPISIETAEIAFDTHCVVAETTLRQKNADFELDHVVTLRAKKLDAPRVNSRPISRGRVTLQLSWPGSNAFPWSDFDVPAQDVSYGDLNEPQRRLIKILRLFRSHGQARLAKFRGAIEHRRRTKGTGKLVLQQLLTDNVLSLEGRMYFLDPDRLAKIVGLSFHDVHTGRTTQAAMEFLKRALDQNP